MQADFDLNQQTYDWCARAFDQVRKLLGIRIKMHHRRGQIDAGDIFLFNHFARFETFIPQYLIYQETGEFCRSIAAAEFFRGNDRFAATLRDLGVVPNDHPNLMELLANDVLRGRKIVVFPEGGMVKDRQVIDDRGRYSVFSRSAGERRKHHNGAARLAIGLQIFKFAVSQHAARGQRRVLQGWADELGLASVDALINNARRPVTIVPANITFYPLRISDNILRRGAELLPGKLSQRAVEELIIEGNILLKATDMDINLAEGIRVDQAFGWFERPVAGVLARGLPDLASIFDIEYLQHRLTRRTATRAIRISINRLRDRYMQKIYSCATVNLSHLASCILLDVAESGEREIAEPHFRRALYLAIKHVQKHDEVRLHRGLCDPWRYQSVLDEEPQTLLQFLDSAVTAGLIERTPDKLVLKDKLVQEHSFDQIRLENPIEVYANEVEPLKPVRDAARNGARRGRSLDARDLARELFDDEIKSLEWDHMIYDQRKHYEVNSRETARADPSPFLLIPKRPKSTAVVLIHGFLASPAEVRAFGGRLSELGYPVVGVRLKGHGTSPWDLRDRSWKDWMKSVEQGIDIIRPFGEQTAMVGFSTGGSLALALAADRPADVAAAVAICAPVKFRNKNMRFVPLMHGANRIVRWLSSYEGLMPFRPNESEHPNINYRNMPLRGLYELTRLASHLHHNSSRITRPVCVIQATGDRVVDPKSADIVFEAVAAEQKELHWIDSNRHGILNEDVGETQQVVIDFLARLDEAKGSTTNAKATADERSGSDRPRSMAAR